MIPELGELLLITTTSGSRPEWGGGAAPPISLFWSRPQFAEEFWIG